VWDEEEANSLYWNGFFGSPLGVEKPRGKFSAPLILDFFEGLYLARKGRLRAFSGTKELSPEELMRIASSRIEGFGEKYAVYEDLRERGFVVIPAIKYGAHFMVYEKGPGLEHAPYLVRVVGEGEGLQAEDVIAFGRLATSVRKVAVYAVVGKGKISYVGLKWFP